MQGSDDFRLGEIPSTTDDLIAELSSEQRNFEDLEMLYTVEKVGGMYRVIYRFSGEVVSFALTEKQALRIAHDLHIRRMRLPEPARAS